MWMYVMPLSCARKTRLKRSIEMLYALYRTMKKEKGNSRTTWSSATTFVHQAHVPHTHHKNSSSSLNKTTPVLTELTFYVKVSHCLPPTGKMRHFSQEGNWPPSENLINEVRKSHSLRHWCFSVLRLGVISLTTWLHAYNPHILKTHDCNTEILVSILPWHNWSTILPGYNMPNTA